MASSGSLSVTISAVDNASKQIDAINKKLGAMSAPVDRFRKSMDRLSSNAGVATLSHGIRDMSGHAEKLFASLSRAVPALGELGAGLSIAGFAGATRHFASVGNDLELLARRAGVGTTALQRIGNMGAVSGGSFDGAAASVADLNAQLHKAKIGTADPQFLGAMSSMFGANFAKVIQGKPDKVMDQVLHKLAAMHNAQKELQYGTAIFGASFQQSLFPAVQAGTSALDSYIATARKMAAMSPVQVRSLQALNSQFNRLGQDTEALAGEVIGRLAPGLAAGAEAMAAWVEANKNLIAQDVHSWIKTVNGDMTALARKLNAIIAAENNWGKTRGIIGHTDAQNNALRTERENSFDAWMYKRLGIHTGLWNRMFGGASPTKAEDVTMDPTKRAFLDTIAQPESRGRYNVRNGGSRFTDFSQFPAGGPGPGGTSRAAGRYQFIPATWHSLAKVLGLKDFSPQSQDKAGWQLAASAYRARTQRDLESDLRSGRHQSQIVDALKGIWPSLPGGSQQGETMAQFSAALAKNGAREAAGPSGDPAGTVLARLRSQETAAQVALLHSPRAPVVVKHEGGASLTVKVHAPPGTQTSATTDGNVFSGAPRIAAMNYQGASP